MAQSDPFKVINYDTFDFKQSAIIKPASQNFDDTHRLSTKTTFVVINSADRNKAYSTPSDYVAELYEEIQDVISVELKFADLHHNEYNITDASNTLYVSTTSQPSATTVTLVKGIYKGTDLAFALTAIFPAAGFNATYNASTQHINLTATEEFTLLCDSKLYDKGSLLKMLGFPCANQTAIWNATNSTFELESKYALDLRPNNTIVMNIDTMNVKVSNNNIFNKAFAVIPQNLNDIRTSDIFTIKKNFNPPMGRIERMHIRFNDIHGNPYDFQNRDHILEFAFESHKNIRKYNAYLS